MWVQQVDWRHGSVTNRLAEYADVALFYRNHTIGNWIVGGTRSNENSMRETLFGTKTNSAIKCFATWSVGETLITVAWAAVDGEYNHTWALRASQPVSKLLNKQYYHYDRRRHDDVAKTSAAAECWCCAAGQPTTLMKMKMLISRQVSDGL